MERIATVTRTLILLLLLLQGSTALSKMGLEEDEVKGAVRFTVGRGTEEEDIVKAADAIAAVANDMWAARK
eukprot:1107908-Rhodomonas_salina.3